jgi:hypothetical protein
LKPKLSYLSARASVRIIPFNEKVVGAAAGPTITALTLIVALPVLRAIVHPPKAILKRTTATHIWTTIGFGDRNLQL